MAKIIIIGGGVSGLSAGIHAKMSGHDAIICERHSSPGGNLTGWKRGEYEIDNCIHWLTGTNPSTPTYQNWVELGALGDGIEVFQGDTLYTCRLGGEEISLYRDIEHLKQRMESLSPEDKKETHSLINAVKLMQRICGIGGENHNEGLDGFKGLLKFPTLRKYYSLSTKELSERFKHPLLREFIASFWGDGFGALALIFVFAHFCGDNGGIPQYGSRGMANRMAERFKALGGELNCDCDVTCINHQNGKAQSVALSDGRELSADYFVLTTDPAVAFKHILHLPLPKQIQKMYSDSRFKRFSGVQCAFACKKEALDFRGDLILTVPNTYLKDIGASRLILREFSHEASYAPEGETVLQVMTFCDEDTCTDFIRSRELNRAAYNQKKKHFALAAEQIIGNAIPALEGSTTLLDVWTPATYRRFTDSEIGSYMSFILPKKTIPLRKKNKVDGLDNVILATQWQQCPGGLPIAAGCGKYAIQTIDALENKAPDTLSAPSVAPTAIQ